MTKRNELREEIKRRDFTNRVVAAVTVGLEAAKKREVRFLQPYYKQGNRWYKLNTKGA